MYIKYCNYGKTFSTKHTRKTLKNEAKVSKCRSPCSFQILLKRWHLKKIFPSDLNHPASSVIFISIINKSNLETSWKVINGKTWTILEYWHPCPDGEMRTASPRHDACAPVLSVSPVSDSPRLSSFRYRPGSVGHLKNCRTYRSALKAIGSKLRNLVLFGSQVPVPLLFFFTKFAYSSSSSCSRRWTHLQSNFLEPSLSDVFKRPHSASLHLLGFWHPRKV